MLPILKTKILINCTVKTVSYLCLSFNFKKAGFLNGAGQIMFFVTIIIEIFMTNHYLFIMLIVIC